MSIRGWFWVAYIVVDLVLFYLLWTYVLPFLWAVLAWCQEHPGEVPW